MHNKGECNGNEHCFCTCAASWAKDMLHVCPVESVPASYRSCSCCSCRTNFDCDNLESFLTGLGGGGKFRGKMEKGVENSYSCLVLAGARSMDQRRDALQVQPLALACSPILACRLLSGPTCSVF